ncbi:DNA polymerase III subunit gamma/tau [Fortiea contorta]|uniref:DNA polymerase III subunit gamma/tau n=1 Tax=Fortiea contorta TaxID=1892405 RepID=UPI00036B018D|nr:DNA polymerase III subunit gamma/tau [Fortiea contorta]
MSYEPLHHKYRPKSFAELVGQEAIATTLINAIRSAKIAPAYLFTGPRGTGKTSSARILAKSLNCLQSDVPTPSPCGVCDVCQGITKGYSLDVIEIDAASNTGVDNIREVIEKAQFAPVQCRYKVYVIDECHMLSTQAFNALLKTLEEPPKYVVFVLATTDPQRVLPTIISRCQRFDFRRINLAAMVKHLRAIADNEKISISADAVTLVAQIAQGGLRDAESLLDQLALLSGEVVPDRVWDLVGSVSERDLLTLLNAIAQDHPETVLDCLRAILDRGREPLTILQNLAATYRDLLIAKTAPNRQDLVSCTEQTWQALVDFAHKLDMSTILAGQKHLREAELQLKNTTQPRLWLEVTLLGLLPSANFAPPRYTPPAATNHHRVNTPIQNGTTPHSAPPANLAPSPPPETISLPQPPAAEKPLTPPEPITSPAPELDEAIQHDLTQIWQQVLGNIQQIPKRELLRQMCDLIEFDGNFARVGVKSAWLKRVQSDLLMITTAFNHTFQREINVSLETGTGSTPTTAKKAPTPQNSTRAQQPAPPPAPSPAPPPPPKIDSSPPPKPQPPLANWEHDEATTAAQRLAEFFQGQIVRLSDDALDLSEPMTSSDLIYELDIDDD